MMRGWSASGFNLRLLRAGSQSPRPDTIQRNRLQSFSSQSSACRYRTGLTRKLPENRTNLVDKMATSAQSFYELYRRSSIGLALTDTLDDLISDERINPQLAMKILGNFDQAITEALQKNVKARLQFKGSLDTYRFCDEVWTFLIKNVTFKMDNGSQSVTADKVKIVSCNAKKPE
ncbi:Transcription initiation factor IIA subunit 2 [Neonectria punicea]|uniref:Transcription initiation factor IIA subunit 2 n=2 Tax=Neonectria TaxID=140106 RepID=A0ABR1GVL0_9HYPO